MATDNKAEKSITVHYIKAPNCLDVVVHGAIGGINHSDGRMTISIYSERGPIPKSIQFKVGEDGSLSDELARETKDGIIRTINTVMHFDLQSVVAFHSWLGDNLEKYMKENPSVIEKGEGE